MVTELQHAHSSEPFRWKLFLFVMTIMGAITAAAIVLTLWAHPAAGSPHEPPTQPISQVIFVPTANQNPATVL
ncbi:hypothetical protein [Granulicella arctica]|uniref:Uncharacterized protein n=1 Tax=Granulicella arctica TaxID=940613 RepID=A0A7Y9TGF9_9BACT|nr:hypothetical protein [Granulicella arctica]NYF79449.1 hypothetical protein [Granulicella arctica]